MVPEIILQRAIISGFQAIRKDPRIVNNIFKNLPLTQQEAIKNFILEKSIDFSLNYPRTDVKVPAIVMLLKSESESNNFLGDIMGAPPNYDMPDQDMHIDTLGGHAASTSDMDGLPRKVVGPLAVLESVGDNAIRFTPEASETIVEVFSARDLWPCLRLHVVAGTGAGQVENISSISNDQLDIVGSFELQLDSTSLVDIRYADDPEGPYGEPIRAYTNNTGLLRIGANYEGQYQLEVLAGNQDEVIYLYSVLKAILFSQRKFLEAQGLMSVRISGTDLAPRTEMLPDEIFTRSMTVQFTYPFNFMVEQDVFKQIQLTLASTSPGDSTSTLGEVLVATIEL
ncbi:hypothetical protein HC928_00380 [bacterium]|nr:hypothetical protein [bacterium]